MITITVRPFVKKWLSSIQGRLEHEASEEKASSILADYVKDWPIIEGDSKEDFDYMCIINVPYVEFAELVYELPNFEEVPIMWAAWKDAGQPTAFVLRCIEDNDIIAVDSQGYEYARYRAACISDIPVV